MTGPGTVSPIDASPGEYEIFRWEGGLQLDPYADPRLPRNEVRR